MPPEQHGKLVYPTVEEITETNREAALEERNPHAVIQPANLRFAVDGLKDKYNDKPFEQAVILKAAFLLDALANKGHAFADANKRTALSTTLSFLQYNGFEMDTSNRPEIIAFILPVARGEKSLTAIAKWITKRVITFRDPIV